MTWARAGALATVLWLCGCGETLRAPDFTDRRRVKAEEACRRYEVALREKCGASTTFDCGAYLSEECRGPQRETDVSRCERLIRQSRSCDEALGLSCGQACDANAWPPRF